MNFRFLPLVAAASLAGLSACGGGAGGGSPASGAAVIPQMPIVLSASSLSFLSLGATNSQTVSASEGNYSGAFSASSTTCSAIASIALQPGSTTVFVITPVGAGSCSFSVADTLGQSKPLAVSVTTTTVGGT